VNAIYCRILVIGFLLGVAICAEAQLTTTAWNPAANPSGNGLWTESANWTSGVVPSITNKVGFNVAGARACVISSAVLAGQLVGGDNGPGGTVIVTNGGSLTTSAANWCAIGYNVTNLMIVQSGGSIGFGYQLWIGYNTGSSGTLLMNGGTVTVTNMIGLGWNGGTGTVHVNGGTLNLLQWDPVNSIKGSSVLDIGGGTVVIAGNQLTSVSSFISSGKITGYGGAGAVSSAYNSSANMTTLTALNPLTTTAWNPAGNPSGTGLWTEGANWTTGVVPSITNKVGFNVPGARACVISSAVQAGQFVGGDNAAGGTVIVTNGGSLTTSAANWCAIGYNYTNLMIVQSGGAVNFGNQLWIGLNTGSTGTLLINGGTVTVTNTFGLGWSGGTGIVHVNSGTLSLLQWDPVNSIKGASVLDIGAGMVTITGNQLTSVSSFISSGKITGYGEAGTVNTIFNYSANTTTLTATPSTNVGGQLAIKLVNKNPALSWPTSAVYYVLQSATNLATKPVAWNLVTNSVATSNGTNQVTLTSSSQTMFFRLISAVDPSTMNRKLLMGYQGWFAAPGDGSAFNSWWHWFNGLPTTAVNTSFDFWPDTSELGADELFSTSMTYSNGTTAKLYSAYNQKTVVRHFQWMQTNNLDGVFLQRFLSDLSGNTLTFRNQVVTNVRVGSETYGRVFAIMYDVTGYSTNALVSTITNDWLYLVNTQKITNSPTYLRHKGKPVVAIWGFGLGDGNHLSSPQQAQQVINWFHAAGCTVVGGVASGWRTLSGDAYSDPAWTAVYLSYDVISPWTVGRYNSNSGADSYMNNYLQPDLAYCSSNSVDYMPVIFPGFSWANLQKNGLYNQIPRNGGKFYWEQAYNAVISGCSMVYGAMFDEVDEGTAMFKCVPTAAQLPAQGTFVPLNIDGYNLNSDWYLRLANQAGTMLRGQIPITNSIPITPP